MRGYQSVGFPGNRLQAPSGADALRGEEPPDWLRTHIDLHSYYSYRALCECIHHYDIGMGKNYYYYLNSADQHWRVIPWDIDLTWANTMFGNGNEPFYRPVMQFPVFQIAYRNRLREIRDLLYNPDETGRLIEECAAIIADPPGGPSPVDADRAKWDFHPMMTTGRRAGSGLFYQIAPSKDFRGMVQLMKNYVEQRGRWIDAVLLRDLSVPATPTLTYKGPPGFPASGLVFQASPYRGESSFAAMRYRLAEISPPSMSAGRPTAPGKYEITPVWESQEFTNGVNEVTIPASAARAGHTYRARVRMKDANGSWSHWSPPVQFVPK
jgi:hypothetical protein